MTLLTLPLLSCARIVKHTSSPALRQQLLERGLTEGTPVRVLKKAPLGDPICLEVRGSVLTLRKDLAQHILVAPALLQNTKTSPVPTF